MSQTLMEKAQAPYRKDEVPHFEILGGMNLPEEVQYRVYRGNAIRILGLDLER